MEPIINEKVASVALEVTHLVRTSEDRRSSKKEDQERQEKEVFKAQRVTISTDLNSEDTQDQEFMCRWSMFR